jgi:phosphomannomutase
MSTSQMVDDLAAELGCKTYRAKVGELNVAAEMKKRRAVIGGEGNGGVIYPELLFGRDAAVGMALVLSHLADEGRPVSRIAAELPKYYRAKAARPMPEDFAARMERLEAKFVQGHINRLDGVKVSLPDGSVHVRASNTEPIFRVITEAKTRRRARMLLADALATLGG